MYTEILPMTEIVHKLNYSHKILSKRVQPTGPKEYSLHVVGLLLLQRSTNCTHSSCPPQWGLGIEKMGQIMANAVQCGQMQDDAFWI